MGLIIGGGNTKSGGGGGASAAEKALAQATTLDGRLYNLWEVMPQVKADPRVQGYACIMLAEYYKGLTSITLAQADAYITSDGDFYTNGGTHYWHDIGSVYAERWIAYLWKNEYANYHITSASSSYQPRNVLIDGVFGNYTSANSIAITLERLCVTEGSSIGNFGCQNDSGQVGGTSRMLYIDGIRQKTSYKCVFASAPCVIASIGCETIANGTIATASSSTCTIKTLIFPRLRECIGNGCICGNNNCFPSIDSIFLPELTTAQYLFRGSTIMCCNTIRNIYAPKLTSLNYLQPKLGAATSYCNDLIHFEIGEGFNSDLNFASTAFANCLLSDSNDLVEDLQAHPTWSNLDQWLWNFEHLIVDKLADLSGQTAKTITLAATPYEAITESIRSKMSAKNWNLASA